MPEPRTAMSPEKVRSIAREIFGYALGEASIGRAFEKYISCERGTLRIGEDLYDLHGHERVFVVSIGKAGHTMAAALAERTGAGVLEGIVVAPVEVAPQVPAFRYFRGGHPLPTEESLRAADAVLRALHSQRETSLVIYMISGGASALCEKPIVGDISLADLVETYRVLVHSGAPIAEINAIRKHLSALKGGRMAQAASPANQASILISDVPEGKLDSLASGPTLPDTSSVDDCYRIAEQYGMVSQLPKPVRELFEHRVLEETPKSGDPAFAASRWTVISSNSSAVSAAAEKARQFGFKVVIDNGCDDWDYVAAADYLLLRLREARRSGQPACVISGGEVTVKVLNGGTGGRNQQFALHCATRIAGEPIAILSAGTDGIDGNSPASGAIVDGTTMGRAMALDLSPMKALDGFDAYPLFEALGDAIVTGPTGNNVRDLRLLLAW